MEATDVPPALQERLGTEATDGLLDLFETARQEWTADVTTVERFERRLPDEAGGLRVALAESTEVLRAALTQSETALRVEIAALRTEMRDGDSALRLEMRDANNALRLEMRDLAAGLQSEMRDLAAGLRGEMRDGDTALGLGMRDLAAGLRGEMASLRQENLAARFELLKWCFVLCVGQVFAVAGVVAVVLRLMRA